MFFCVLSVYVCLFLCQSGETETLTLRLEEAEKALALKQGHIDKLKEELEQQRILQETIDVLTQQVSRQNDLWFFLTHASLMTNCNVFLLAGSSLLFLDLRERMLDVLIDSLNTLSYLISIYKRQG